MIAFDVGIEAKVSNEVILSVLRGWFPTLSVTDADELISRDRPWTDIVISAMDHESDFQTKVDFYQFPGPDDESVFYSVAREIARMLSDHFECRSICEAKEHGHEPDYPGTSIVWDEGSAFLADDYGTDYGDGEGGPVRIEKPISIDSEKDSLVLKKVVRDGT